MKVTFLISFDNSIKFSSSNIVGFLYFPIGTLNCPLLFSLYSPLKHVLFRNIKYTYSGMKKLR